MEFSPGQPKKLCNTPMNKLNKSRIHRIILVKTSPCTSSEIYGDKSLISEYPYTFKPYYKNLYETGLHINFVRRISYSSYSLKKYNFYCKNVNTSYK